MKMNIDIKQKLQIILGILIITLLLTVIVMYIEDSKRDKQISETCGWGNENFYCFCEKSIAMEMKNNIESETKINISLIYK